MRGREVSLSLGSASCGTIACLLHFIFPVQRACQSCGQVAPEQDLPVFSLLHLAGQQ